MDVEQRFWAKVDRSDPDGCWTWTGSIRRDGYGQFCLGVGRHMSAHRFAYSHEVGPIPPGMFVCHRCDNKKCVNPSHLFVGTRADNMKDMADKGRAWNPTADANRAKTHCVRGHEYTPENTYVWSGRRYCRECRAEKAATRRALREVPT